MFGFEMIRFNGLLVSCSQTFSFYQSSLDRRWLPLLFLAVFLPLFAIQIFMINRYSTQLGLSGTSGNNEDRRTAPQSEKIYIAADGR